jgi:hypothetical protein
MGDWIADARQRCEDSRSLCDCPPCLYCDEGIESAPCTCASPHRPPCPLPMALDELDALRAQNARLSDVARDLVRQVEEFETWDEKDWPAALGALREHASAARRALEEG